MISKFTKIFDTPRLIQFTSPLPIKQCAERLQESISKPMGCQYTPIKGHVEKVDDTTYTFALHQDYRGGHKITGRLTTQTDSSTRIDALHTVDRTSWSTGILFAVVMIVMFFVVEIPKGELTTALWLSIVFVVITAGILFTSLKAQSISQLMWWFERTPK